MGLKDWTTGEFEELLELKERTQAFHFKRRNSRLGEFVLHVLFLYCMKMCSGPYLNWENLNFCFILRFLDFSRNRLAAYELPPGGTCGYTQFSGFADDPPSGRK